eukprot:m.98851 g.98851  ORF g.98851 m.98851 type:complete len:363 (-) comp13128_c0_seq5:164-1252(-)
MKVAIVGGGIIGVSTAYYLTLEGHDVTVIEATEIAAAASGKAGGFLARDWCRGPLDALAKLSFGLHASLAEEHGNPWEYRPLTAISGVHVPEHDTYTDKEVTWLDGLTQEAEIIGTPDNTAQVTPALFVRGLMQRAEERGATVLKGFAAGVQIEDGAAVGVQLRGGEVVPADRVVLCMGPWSQRATEWAGLEAMPKVDGFKHHSIVMHPSEPDAITAHAVFTSVVFKSKMENPEIYPRPDGSVYMCGVSDPHAPLPEFASEVKVSDPDRVRTTIHGVASNLSSRLKAAPITTVQACFLPSGPDSLPIIGELPTVRNLFMSSGHTCWGILTAPASGLVMAQLISGKKPSVPIDAFSPARFTQS